MSAEATGDTITVPAGFVDLLRAVLVEELAECAGEIESSARIYRGEEIEGELFENLDAYRALLDQVGWVRAHPAVRVKVELGESRGALVAAALRERLDCERGLMYRDHSKPGGAGQRRRAQRRAREIEEFMSAAGLGDG
ncbi:MAG: hypothetical protein ACRDLF_02385 [Solirubrobacteraceae bacterium]